MVSTVKITAEIFKKSEDFNRYSCLSCNGLLNDPVQLACGHRLCRTCAEKLISTAKEGKITPKCPDTDCNEELSDEDGAYVSVWFPVKIMILHKMYPFAVFPRSICSTGDDETGGNLSILQTWMQLGRPLWAVPAARGELWLCSIHLRILWGEIP